MEIERKALYNLLRINWEEHPNGDLLPWQIEDYRALETEVLFSRLHELEVYLDEQSFFAYADSIESPEELAASLTGEDADAMLQDQIYLLIFELWRRLVPHKITLSIFCDELDHLIHLYDQGKLSDLEPLQNALAALEDILEDSCDEEEADPKEVFINVAAGCANDLESFFFDFISDQIESGSEIYALELVDAFYDYVSDVKWFKLLRARLLADGQPEMAHRLVLELLEEGEQSGNLDFQFSLLELSADLGDERLFEAVLHLLFPRLETEGDFQEVLRLTADLLSSLDRDSQEQAIQQLLSSRLDKDFDSILSHSDPAVAKFQQIMRFSSIHTA